VVAGGDAALTRLHGPGIRTVVDLTVLGLGRDVARVARVAERVPVHLVAATGYYTSNVLPPFFRTHGPGRLVGGPDPLVGYFVRDIEEGITEDVARVLAAASEGARTTRSTGTTRTSPAGYCPC
jgi:phosphotriesterase-related protein